MCPLSAVAEPGWRGSPHLTARLSPPPRLPPSPLFSCWSSAGEAGAPPSHPFPSWGCWVLISAVLCPGTQTLLGVTVSADGWTPSDGYGPVGSGTSLLSVSTHPARAGLLWRPLPCRAHGLCTHPFPARREREEGVHLEDQLISHLTGFPSERPSLVGLLLAPHPCRGSRVSVALCCCLASRTCRQHFWEGPRWCTWPEGTWW